MAEKYNVAATTRSLTKFRLNDAFSSQNYSLDRYKKWA